MLSNLEKSDEMDVDEAVTAAAPLYRQLLTAYAEVSSHKVAVVVAIINNQQRLILVNMEMVHV